MPTTTTAPETANRALQSTGNLAFFFSGICSISSGVVVSLLQGRFGFAYGITGTLLSLMSVGNLLAGFASGLLPGRIGFRRTALLLSAGYAVGYLLMTTSGLVPLLALAFFLVGIAKGGAINTCTTLVGAGAPERTKGMNIMHACYALGALLCPFLIMGANRLAAPLPTLALAALGLALWATFARMLPRGGALGGAAQHAATDWGFLHSARFWALTGLLFCQNAAETSVTGWLVTYFKDNGILSGLLSTYTVTVMWGATLVARLLIAFVFPIKRAPRFLIGASVLCTLLYFVLMQASGPAAAIGLLFAFAAAMAGMNPTAVAAAGRETSVTSLGIMLPAAGLGAVLMPWIIGLVAERVSLSAGMMCNLVPCAGMLVFSLWAQRAMRSQTA